MIDNSVTVVGAGLAGSEAAWQLAERGIPVRLIEMRPVVGTAVHQTDGFAELVCSNSMKSLDAASAAGSLKNELALMGSGLLAIALDCSVAAGKALAVDRLLFSQAVTSRLRSHPLISIELREFTELAQLASSSQPAIIATGPLTSDRLADALSKLLGLEQLAFFDAAAPIVEAESLDFTQLFSQSRYSEAEGDYLNAALDQQLYEQLVRELTQAQRVISRDFETADLFQACQPIEEVARKGLDTLRYGAMKPVGITDPKTGRRPWAVIQLRAENRQRSAYNLVGFQTNLTYGEQERVFRMIPGLEQAGFLRFGVMHRNTFIDSPRLLTPGLALRQHPHIRIAGQLAGTEGYVEAIASGLMAALAVYADIKALEPPRLPTHSLFGALLEYATDSQTSPYQPMHVNFGLIEPLAKPIRNKRQRNLHYTARAAKAIGQYIQSRPELDWLPALPTGFLEDWPVVPAESIEARP